MKKSLDTCVTGEKGKVCFLSAEGKMRRRLFDMGITPGVEIEFKKAAPLKDPVEITLRGYNLSLRKEEAKNIWLEV